MQRLLILSIPAFMIMIGFIIPFFIASALGVIVAIGLVLLGAWLFWIFEIKTVHKLKENSGLNDILNTRDGD